MNDNRDDSVPPDPTPPPDPASDPVPPHPQRWYVDDKGNIKGPVFSFSSENLHLFCDKAVTDPAELAAFRKPPA